MAILESDLEKKLNISSSDFCTRSVPKIEFPQLSLKKQDILLLVVDTLDDRGDLEHFKSYFQKIRQLYPNLKIAAAIGGWASNVSFCNALINFLDNYKKVFTDVHVCIDSKTECNGRKFEEMESSYKKTIDEKLIIPYRSAESFIRHVDKNVALIVQVSVRNLEFSGTKEVCYWLYRKKLANIPWVIFGEYGAPKSKDEGIHDFSMGLTKDDIGVRLVEEWQTDITLESKATELLKVTNQAFLQHLLNCESPNITDAIDFLNRRRVGAGHLQSETSTALFIATQAFAFLDPAHGIDYYLSAKNLNQQVIAEVLSEIGVRTTDIEFVSIKSTDPQEKQKAPLSKIRIFSNKDFTLDDLSYKALCYASLSVPSSGDDSWTTAFSTTNVPFYIESRHYWKSSIKQGMVQRLNTLGCFTLIEYLELFSNEKVDVLVNGYLIANASLKTFLLSYKTFNEEGLPYAYGMPNDPKTLSEVRKALTIAFSKKMGAFIKNNFSELSKELVKFRNHLDQSCNVFNRLPNILMQALINAEPSDTSVDKKMLTYYSSKLIQNSGNDVSKHDKEQIKIFLTSQIPAETSDQKWKYNIEKKLFWLVVNDEPKYKKLLESKNLADVITIEKVKNKNEYFLSVKQAEILKKIQPVTRAKLHS